MHRSDNKAYVIIVDDEPHFTESLQIALEDTFVVATAASIGEARELLKESIPDAVVLDVRLPDGNGIDYLSELKTFDPMPVVIIMTAYGVIDDVVTAVKEGAADYVTKPLEIEKLKRLINVYLENRLLQKKITVLDREMKKIHPPFITSGTGKMKEIIDRVPMVAHLEIPILISGETGTGKEKLSEWIHALSGFRGDLVAINCATLPKDILESELFGYTKGAFSGAVLYKKGLVEQASGGTLFLDEIGELPDSVQAKLLRVLDDGVYYKIGETIERRVKFRLITATNRDLMDPANNFRKDLFFRIHGITFELPPLRERRQDIPLLVAAFIEEANNAYYKKVRATSPEAMEYLMEHNWPGNIRELKWMIHRAVAMASKEVLELDEISISSGVSNTSRGADIDQSFSFQEAIENLEKKYIQDALSLSHNNKTAAAKILGISLRVLHYKIKKYQL